MWYVFEGLDGVGKSSLMREVALVLGQRGLRTEALATPLTQHQPLRRLIESLDRIEMLVGFYIGAATATAAQALALIEARRADVVLVDRYIYSTLALAHALGVELDPEIEREFRSDRLRPTGGFLITSEPSVRAARIHERGDLREIEQQKARDVIETVSARYRQFGLHSIENTDGLLHDSAEQVAAIILKQCQQSE